MSDSNTPRNLPQLSDQQAANIYTRLNELFEVVSAGGVMGIDPSTSTGLTWGYIAGRLNGIAVNSGSNGTVTLTNAATNYVVVNRTTGAVSVSTATTNWNNGIDYARAWKVVTAGGAVSSWEDWRVGGQGLFGGSGAGASGAQCIPVACSDETTGLTTGTAKVTFRMPYAFTLTAVRASLTTAQGSGTIFTVDINEAGTTILSTKLTIDNGEKTSTTAATPAVISDTSLADDAEITIDIDQIGDGTAKGLKVYLIGTPT